MMMPFQFIDKLKDKAGHMAFNTFFYDWSLKDSVPDRLIVRPVDPCKGDAEQARELLDAAGVKDRNGPMWDTLWWSPNNADELWRSHMHGFTWLRDLRALDGVVAREQGRLMIESWIVRYQSWNKETWRADLIGRRLSMWICHHEFFCVDADDVFQDLFLMSIVKQAKHLSHTVASLRGLNQFFGLKGLLYAGIALEGHEFWIEQALDVLRSALREQILADGGHVSRNPQILLDTLEILTDIRSALKAGAYPVPEFLNEAIASMSGAVRFLRYRDRRFAVFNGAQEGNTNVIDTVLAQAGVSGKTKKSLPESGYERVELGRGFLLVDTGAVPPPSYDQGAHASALSFEYSYGKERLFVSCGSHPFSPEWKDALRFTSAHNTACLDMRNSCEIRKDGHFGRKVVNPTVHRQDAKNAALLIASHDGYVPLNGITHARKFYLSDEGNHLRGEDSFSCPFELMKPVNIALRFHLHPAVQASLVQDGEEVLLRMPGGIGWRFKHSVGVLKIEESLYLGDGSIPRKTMQLVIYGEMSNNEAIVKWSVKREG